MSSAGIHIFSIGKYGGPNPEMVVLQLRAISTVDEDRPIDPRDMAQTMSFSTSISATSRRISAMVEKGFGLTAIAGEDGKLISAFTKKSTARELSIVEVSDADPGASHAYRLSVSTLQHVAHNGESWVFAYLPEKKYKSQTIIKCQTLEAMLAQIKYSWKKGYRISSVAYGRGHWVAVATQYANPGEQSFFTACDAEILQEKTKQAWDEGKRITGITYGDGKWLVILSQSATMYSQKWLTRKSFNDLRAKVREEWSQGFQITSLARGAGVWLVVFSKRAAK